VLILRGRGPFAPRLERADSSTSASVDFAVEEHRGVERRISTRREAKSITKTV